MEPTVAPDIANCLQTLGLSKCYSSETGHAYDNDDGICIIIDIGICEMREYQYIDYTTQQNRLFNRYQKVFRFVQDDIPPADLANEIELFVKDRDDVDLLRKCGRNRTEQDIDPTRPEAIFEDRFIAAFGEANRNTLYREFPYFDREGKSRYIDYALFSRHGKYAIELNGESFHHPSVIGLKKYRSQLFKQNSLSADGFKVFRWSERGMRDHDNFEDQLRTFLGNPEDFICRSDIRIDRTLATLKLLDHQIDALEQLNTERKAGRRNFLVVLPTGTGKTEIFIKDIELLWRNNHNFRALILVPSSQLRTDTVSRFKKRMPHLRARIGSDFLSQNQPLIVVQTYAYMHRHYYDVATDSFDYILVDEAHHAAAVGLRRVLEHFNPEHLVGVTATPERFDQQKLEDIFGEYESQLTLPEAIKKELVPPVRCYRIASNIDLSNVRFNGKEYVKSDLQRTLHVPSRDQLIVDILQHYFSGSFAEKQGVVFCVDIAHARRMAAVLNKFGISALAVDGKDRRRAKDAQHQYRNRQVRFLCACDLLTEGWDAPQTQILVMARPTFSKVLYTQQLGRGLRHYVGKEALYVLDVVDNYGARLAPMSLHALLGINSYCPFENLIDSEKSSNNQEIITLDGLFEGIRRIEPVDITTFSNLYGDYLNEEQLARELFISTGTVKAWLRKGVIEADHVQPFGRSTLHFFDPNRVEEIRINQKLPLHSEETRYNDFFNFLKERDYTFSYKIIFLLAFMMVKNHRGEADLPALITLYQKFYFDLRENNGSCEKKNCPYNKKEYLADTASIQSSILRNPFEKFERKRFFHHCRDLNYIALDSVLLEKLNNTDYTAIREQMLADLVSYYQKFEVEIQQSDYSFLLPQEPGDKIISIDQTTPKLTVIDKPKQQDIFSKVVPLYPLEIAAGSFAASIVPDEPDGWVVMEGLSSRPSFDSSMFVAQIHGKSMEPLILDGSYCLFSRNVGGTRQNRIVLARHGGHQDAESGAEFTIKRYYSEKKTIADSEWRHERIILRPENPDFDDIIIPAEEAAAGDFSVVAFWIEVLL